MKHPLRAVILAAIAPLALSGCVTDDYGYGGSSVSLGYGTGYYGADPYWGWYDDYYYPGTGYYIYDRGGAPHRWSDSQRRYWESRRGNRQANENWSGFRGDRNPGNNAGTPAWRGRGDGQGLTDEARQQRREAWQARREQLGQQPAATDAERQQRREAWQARRQQLQQQQGAPGNDAARQSWQARRDAWQAQRQSGEGAQPRSERQGGGPAWRGRRGGGAQQ